MHHFTYYNPTRVVFGRDAELQVGTLLQQAGVNNVALHFGGSSAERSGLLNKVRKSLKEAAIDWIELGGVRPNPRYEDVCRYTAACVESQVEFILAVGGGSVIDSAKAVAAASANPGVDIWEATCGRQELHGALPVGVVLTIAAAGSEASPNFILSHDALKEKRSFAADFLRPKFALMNPVLTYTLPQWQKSCAIADILMHTLERYFSPVESNQLTDRLAESVMKTVIEVGPVTLQESENYDAHSELMWAGFLSHCDLTGLGGVSDWATHQLGHALSAVYDYSHGATLTATWGAWARYIVNNGGTARFARYAQQVWGVTPENKTLEEICMNGILRTEDFFLSLGLPICLPALCGAALSEEQLHNLTKTCSYQGTRTIGRYKVLNETAIHQIYTAANQLKGHV